MAEGRPIYRMLSPLFWDDPGVQALDAHNQLIAAHILTSRQTNGAGLFRFSLAEAEETIAKVSGTYAIRFAKVCDTLNWRFHKPSKTLYLPTWWKWNPPDNPKHLIGAMKCLFDVPQTPLLKEFASNTTWLKPNLHDTFRIRIAYVSARYPIQEQEQEHETEHEHDAGTGNSCPEPKEPLTDFTFPCNGPVKEWTLPQFKFDEFIEAYPNLDMTGIMTDARQWCRDNEAKRKTAKGMTRFLGSWIQRSNDKPARGNGTNKPFDLMDVVNSLEPSDGQ